jgi:hypothetical protein
MGLGHIQGWQNGMAAGRVGPLGLTSFYFFKKISTHYKLIFYF